MIIGIAEIHGVNLTKTAAADLLLTFAASVAVAHCLNCSLDGCRASVTRSMHRLLPP